MARGGGDTTERDDVVWILVVGSSSSSLVGFLAALQATARSTGTVVVQSTVVCAYQRGKFRSWRDSYLSIITVVSNVVWFGVSV